MEVWKTKENKVRTYDVTEAVNTQKLKRPRSRGGFLFVARLQYRSIRFRPFPTLTTLGGSGGTQRTACKPTFDFFLPQHPENVSVY